MTMSKQDRRGAPSIYAESMTKGTHIKFPDYMFEWLENKVGSGEYRSRSDVVRQLIEQEMEWEEENWTLQIVERGNER